MVGQLRPCGGQWNLVDTDQTASWMTVSLGMSSKTFQKYLEGL